MQQNLQQFKTVDKSFKLKNTLKYHLTVRFTEKGFSYCVYDPSKKQFLILSNHENLSPYDYDSVIVSDEILTQPFAQRRAIVPSPEHTLIPNEYFSLQNHKNYTLLNFTDKVTSPYINEIPSLRAKQLFLLHNKIQNTINHHFPGASIIFDGTPLLEGLIQQSNQTDKPLGYFHITQNELDIAIFNNGKLLFYNRFTFKNGDEFIYFPLFVCHQLSINPKDLHVFMLGTIHAGEETYQLIHEHFHKVNFGELSKELYFSKAMTHIPQHRFYSLLNIELCG